MHTVFPLGTTVYDPERCASGYTLVDFYGQYEDFGVELVDMNGRTVHRWDQRSYREPKLLPNGNLLLGQPVMSDKGIQMSRVREYNWDGELVWQYEPPESVKLAEAYGVWGVTTVRRSNGNTYITLTERVPWEYMQRIADPIRRRRVDYVAGRIVEVTPAGEIVWDWKSWEHLDMNQYLEIDEYPTWTHFNSLQELPENQWHDAGDLRFRPGNLLVSPRTLGFIFIVDRQSGEIVWRSDPRIPLAGQHGPRMIPKGAPGAGNILLVDNGVPGSIISLGQFARSHLVEINPVTFEIPWRYGDGSRFFTPYTSNVQRLPNGNTLTVESYNCRVFEVTPEGEIVWECVFDPQHLAVSTVSRFPYDYCPPMKALGRPREEQVVPPPHAVTKDGPFSRMYTPETCPLNMRIRMRPPRR
ncbi:MAG: aryl-sulfate sulfotransferase [Chloroflexi bacterium]|nr:aryl-sulfate sulfotransferase [Chloroflexota bacterium]